MLFKENTAYQTRFWDNGTIHYFRLINLTAYAIEVTLLHHRLREFYSMQ
jgi:hypothetical protein